MRVLIIGAGGFIGSHVAAALSAAGHSVRAAVRDAEGVKRRLPFCDVRQADIARLLEPDQWAPLLRDVDAVVNCAGLLQADKQLLEAVHCLGPAALFAACAQNSVTRVVHVSAVSAKPEADTAYALSKWRGEQALRSTDLDWVVLKPSLVWSPSGSYGGTSALRGLAALPFLVPLIGKGQQVFTPITVQDLAQTIAASIRADAPSRITLEPCGPETLTMRELLARLREWLGLPKARFVELPLPLVRFACRWGDWLGRGPVTTTSLQQLEFGNAANPQTFAEAVGFAPLGMSNALARHPAQEQDRWHARLYFLEPLLSAALAVLWLGSGLAGLLASETEIVALLGPLGLGDGLALMLARAASLFDIAIAVALIAGWRPQLIGLVQIITILVYTGFLSLLQPALWLAPLGPLLKNIPIFGTVAAHMVLASKR